MKRTNAGLLASLIVMAGLLAPQAALAAPEPDLTVGDGSVATETDRQKIDVMGIWAHPDDDAGFTTPCGVWSDLYGIRCGIIMATRGEGGSNSVGPESGPDLGLRRENEDRTSHIRSGTVDIFNLDRVDFYYNTSAPLTAQVWDDEETLRRTVRILRETQPEILVGGTPSLAAGHGNHQYAQGRMVWEAAAAAADPTRFPEQLSGVGAVEPWQVKKILAGGLTTGAGGLAAPRCMDGFVPAADNPFTVVGTWTGFESPYTWAAGNTAGQPAGAAKTWAQVGREGGRAHPTQARVMQKTPWDATCQRYGVSESLVPMQPNGSPDAADDEAVFYGATIADPGGMPLGSLFYLEAEDYFGAAGEPFTVTVTSRSGSGTVPAGRLSLDVPEGWQVSDPIEVGGIDTVGTSVDFTVTPSADATAARYKIAARFAGGDVTAYNDTRVQLVSPIDGRFVRTGTAAEYDAWTDETGAYVAGLSVPTGEIGAGESMTTSVDVTNRSSDRASGTVELSVPAGFAVDAASKSFTGLAAGATGRVDFVLTHEDPTAAGGSIEKITAVTTSSAGESSETMDLYLVPSVSIPELDAAPDVDGVDAGYGDAQLDLSAVWEGAACEPAGVDCGNGSYAKVGWSGDSLFAFLRVSDDIAGAAATPERCFGHWLTDSVELLIDPRGDSIDTSPTFKLGVFPFTDDPTGANGTGADGPCWSRDADNHQGFSTGPLAETIEAAPNAPGVQVAVSVERDSSGAYAGGGYAVEIEIPLADLPAAVGPTSTAPAGAAEANDVDPEYMGLNLTPYDSDTQDFIGQTRTAWSAFGSQQSEPSRWGHAYLEGYVPPADRATEAPDAIIPDTALRGVDSPQTIYQSAVRGGTISGVQPSEALTVGDVTIADGTVAIDVESTETGSVSAFLWNGDARYTPVWTSSCPDDEFGFDACSESDGAAPPWGDSLGGRLLGSVSVPVAVGASTVTVELSDEAFARLSEDSSLLLSFAEGGGDETTALAAGTAEGDGVNAWFFPIVPADAEEPEPSPEPSQPGDGDDGASPSPGDGAPGNGSGDGGVADGDGDPLGITGTEVAGIVGLALALLAAGAAAFALSRRKRRG